MTHFGGEIRLEVGCGWQRLPPSLPPSFPEEERGEDRTLQGSRENEAQLSFRDARNLGTKRRGGRVRFGSIERG